MADIPEDIEKGTPFHESPRHEVGHGIICHFHKWSSVSSGVEFNEVDFLVHHCICLLKSTSFSARSMR